MTNFPIQTIEFHIIHAGHARGRHCNPRQEMVWILRGTYHLEIEGRQLTLSAGSGIWYRPGQHHEPLVAKNQGCTLILLEWDSCPETDQPGYRIARDPGSRLSALALWAWQAWQSDRDQARVLAGAFVDAFRRLTETVVEASPGDAIDAAALLIRVNIDKPLTVNELAQMVGLGRRTLERRFQQRFGCSPKVFQQVLRLERAMQMKATDGMSKQEIGQKVGWTARGYLSRRLDQAGRKLRSVQTQEENEHE